MTVEQLREVLKNFLSYQEVCIENCNCKPHDFRPLTTIRTEINFNTAGPEVKTAVVLD